MSEHTFRMALGAVLVCLAGILLYLFLQARTVPPSPEPADVAEVQEVRATEAGERGVPVRVPERALLAIGEAQVRVEVVRSQEDRTRGLSGRKTLEQGTGMLFVFSQMDMIGIWMPDMYVALDIVWLDDTFRVVHVHQNATPESYPEVFYPPTPAQYVLEIPAGYAQAHGITTGAVAVLSSSGETANLP